MALTFLSNIRNVLLVFAVDCVGHYVPDVACNATCGVGSQLGVYNVTTPATNGGADCPAANGTSAAVGLCVTACPKDVKLSLGPYHSCAVKSDGSVVCWGVSFATDATNGVPAGTNNVESIAAADRFTVALKSDETILGWGTNWGAWNTSLKGLTGVKAVATGTAANQRRALCVVLSNGNVQCDTQGGTAVPAAPATLTGKVADVCVGRTDFACALTTTGKVQCWGSVALGSTPPAGTNSNVLNVVCGASHACILDLNGTVSCWAVQAGGGGVNATSVPSTLGSGVKQISSQSGRHTCAIKSDDTVACWGFDHNSQVSGIPAGLTGVVHIGTGDDHSCAMKADGKVVCWGSNSDNKRTVPASLL